LKEKFFSADQLCRALGPFSIQLNNTTREFEYPWAFEAGQLGPGLKVLEIGGGLAGFQFALSAAGCRVLNVDPGMKSETVDWRCDPQSIARLNSLFKTTVEVRPTTIEKANLADNEFDCIYCLSVIEHLSAEAAASVMSHAFRSLKPGAKFILTVDLSLNIAPFASRQSNEFGVNQRIPDLMGGQPWKLVEGRRNELFGFPEFDPDKILSHLENYYVGRYPSLAQCFVLQKRA
jgi:SAM-dependent methyltransferase